MLRSLLNHWSDFQATFFKLERSHSSPIAFSDINRQTTKQMIPVCFDQVIDAA